MALWGRVAPACLLLLAGAAASDGCDKALPFVIHGVTGGSFLKGSGSAAGDKLTLQHNSGVTVFSACTEEWEAEGIAQLRLLGQELSFVVDVADVGCACNLALYLTAMPARGFGGEFSPGENRGAQPPYYCDANMIGGQWCPEVDLMEANAHVLQSTLHNCEPPQNGHYNYCDRVGCAQTTMNSQGSYGPGRQYTIDTTRPFRVRTAFFEEAGAFAGMRTTLQQGQSEVVLDHQNCESRYMSSLTEALRRGMALSVTYWGTDARTMEWLDGQVCGQAACDNPGAARISNITIARLPAGVTVAAAGAATPVGGGQTWAPNEWAPWECHHYDDDQRGSSWCSSVGFEDGYEYKYTNGQGSLCGVCWCCKRSAHLVAPTPSAWQPSGWQSPATTQPPSTTEPPPPPLNKEPLKIGGMPGMWLAGQGFSADGDKVKIAHDAGLTVFDAQIADWDPRRMAEFKLLGQTLTFTVDLSAVGCACNLALYLVAMPARDATGGLSAGANRGGQPAYYCDANQVGGQWCPEIDIMEANSRAFQATLHRCDSPRHRHYDFCDRGGCAQNTRERSGAYGPSAEYTIDTTRPFDVSTAFVEDAGVLAGMRTTLRQRGQSVVLEHSECHAGYLAKLTDALQLGMSLRITYWGGEAQMMAWMDAPPCDQSACSGENAGHAIISDLRITRGAGAAKWDGVVMRFSPGELASIAWERPASFAVMALAASGLMGAMLAARRATFRRRPEGGCERTGGGRGRSDGAGRTSPRSPEASRMSMRIDEAEGPSPVRRHLRGSQLPMSPVTGSRLHLLQHMESSIE